MVSQQKSETERLTRPRHCQAIRHRKLDVTKLQSDDIQEQLQRRLAEELPPVDSSSPSGNAEGTWIRTKDVTVKVASEVLRYGTTKHKDWFDDQDAEARALLDLMHSTHLAWINDKSSSAKKAAYARARSRAQTKLWDMKDQQWKAKSVELQAAADRHDLKALYQALKTVYGPRETGSIPVRSIDSSLPIDNVKIWEGWAEHFQVVLNQHSDCDTSVLDELPQWPKASHLDKVYYQHQRRRSIRC